MNEIICDVNVWYNIASGNIKEEEIDKLNLVGTAVNLTEIVNSSYLISNPKFLKRVIQSLTKYHYQIYISYPFEHIMTIFDSSFIPDDSLNQKLLNEFSLFTEIDDFDDISDSAWENIRNIIDKKKSDKSYVAEVINKALKYTQEEIRSKHIKKSYPKFCHKNSWKNFFIMIISAYSKDYYNKDFIINVNDNRWILLDFFLTVWSEYFKKLDVQIGSKFHDNDIHDLFNLVYVQPDKKYWTYEKRSWAKVIMNNTSINAMLFNLSNCKTENVSNIQLVRNNKLDINNDIGQKIKDLWKKYNIEISGISQGNFVRKLPERTTFKEQSSTEFRVELKYHDDDFSAFSVFIEDDLFEKLQKKPQYMDIFIWTKAGLYMNLLINSVTDVYDKAPFDRHEPLMSYDNNIHFKTFLKNYNIKITTDTIDDLVDYSYRLYQDSKFFAEIKSTIGVASYSSLIKDFIKLIKTEG